MCQHLAISALYCIYCEPAADWFSVQGTSQLKHRRGYNEDVVLIPQPTNDPEDPLNWSTLRKEYHFWLLITWGVLVAASINWSGPVWVCLYQIHIFALQRLTVFQTILQNDLNTTLDDLNISAALCFAFLAIGCILLQPTAMKIGRRPVYILGTLLNLVGCIMGGFQRNIEVYYVVNILTGFGSAPVDSLVQISTTDLFFAHERGTRLSLFALALGTGSYMGPVAAGYITEAQSWQFCFWYLVIFFGIVLALQIFTLEESTYRRPLPEPESQFELESANSVKEDGSTGKGPSVVTRGNRRDTVNTISTFTSPRPTYWQRMAPIHTRHANPKKWWWLGLFPFRLVIFPAILWAGIMTGIQIMWLSLLSVTQSELFSDPPYNFGIAAGMFLVFSHAAHHQRKILLTSLSG
jgi:MFS family permease